MFYDFCLVPCLLCFNTVACPESEENSVDADHVCLLFQYLLHVYFVWPQRNATSQSIRSTPAGKHTVSVLSCSCLIPKYTMWMKLILILNHYPD